MHAIDWILVAAPLLFVFAVAAYTHRYVRSVADFVSAGRCAGRYLLANARGESDSGLSNTMSKFEVILISGFVLNFWEKISVPVILLVGITGFVVYRFRETRALTLAQFFEQRYSRNFRLYMGVLAFISGILNYGIFPAISARFFIYFLHLPEYVNLWGLSISTMALIMFGYLTCTVIMVLVGGQVTLMVTDCFEGILSHLIYIIIAISVFFIITWKEIVEVMAGTAPGKSMINPFDSSGVEDFNIWFVIMSMLITIYTTMALQNKQGFNSAARTPHESRMGHVLGNWRNYARLLMILLLGICVSTFIRHPDLKEEAAPAKQLISQIRADEVKVPIEEPVGSQEWFDNKNVPQLQKQMTAPVALSYLLPIGVKGLFCAMMVMGLLAGDSGHMHSWGSILVQDVILPLKKNPMSPMQQIWAIRFAVIGVAAFAFIFSLLWQQMQYIAFWWAITGGVFTGGAGAAIIGGLYWRRGTTAAAWAAAITGSGLAVAGILCNSVYWKDIVRVLQPMFTDPLPAKFWLNGTQIAFFAAAIAVAVYVIVSWLTCRQKYELDKLLRRGIYSDQAESTPPMRWRERLKVQNILKFDSNFTFSDKLVSAGIFWWSIALLLVNVIVSIINLRAWYPLGAWGSLFIYAHWPEPWGAHGWSHYWMVTAIAFPFIIALATLVWFSIGGIKDTIEFFAALRTMKRDSLDDGRVEE